MSFTCIQLFQSSRPTCAPLLPQLRAHGGVPVAVRNRNLPEVIRSRYRRWQSQATHYLQRDSLAWLWIGKHIILKHRDMSRWIGSLSDNLDFMSACRHSVRKSKFLTNKRALFSACGFEKFSIRLASFHVERKNFQGCLRAISLHTTTV